MPVARVKGRHHIDKRASRLVADAESNDPDELLTTDKTADWLGVSEQWLERGRIKRYGPKYTRLSPRVVRYKRSDVLRWLMARTHSCTSEYAG